MGWDESAGRTFLQREKEDAHDYRYFPDPDLMPVEVGDEWISEIRSRIGEMPAARRARYVDSFGLTPADAAILTGDVATGDFYETAVESGGDPKRVCNLVVNILGQLANKHSRPLHELGIEASTVAAVARLIDESRIAPASALALFESLLARNGGLATSVASSPAQIESIASNLGILQTSDTSAIDAAIDELLAKNPPALQDYRGGKQAAMGALVGMVMKSAKGLNPKIVQERLKQKLS